jgi:hypothetical protein
MGMLRFYLCPPGVIEPADLPIGWGLLIAHPSGVGIARPSDDHERDLESELRLLVSRVARKPNLLGTQIKFPTPW